MLTVSPAVVIAHNSRAAILLVKTRSGWEMPVGTAEETHDQFLSRLCATLFAPHARLTMLPAPQRQFSCDDHATCYALARLIDSEALHPCPDPQEWHSARWASLLEAFHVVPRSQDLPLKWAERILNRLATTDADSGPATPSQLMEEDRMFASGEDNADMAPAPEVATSTPESTGG